MKEHTVLALRPQDQRFIVGIGLAAGILLGVVADPVWKAVDQFDWLPFHGLLNALMTVDVPGILYLRVGILGTIGLGLAAFVIYSSPRVTISSDSIQIRKAGDTRLIKKGQVAGVYKDKGKIVIESAKGRQLYKGDIEGSTDNVAATFKRYGYPWEMR